MPQTETESAFAFPQLERYGDIALSKGGLTILDYFAAHSPAEPADWHYESYGPGPRRPRTEDFGYTEYDPFGDDPLDTPEPPNDDQKRGYVAAEKAYYEDNRVFLLRRDEWASRTWPYAWAEVQMAERARRQG